ncbi:uncharacterized protein NPIL_236691 [Nephila pilipes]|uniref:Uncharacterized protein n=1 Tax=Nephila pilipes TaxID=299642 RepID=A0A8X6N917_NEPPI|nr:uncharacterized protein NPIL_236691 [Nephila pilipes]
MVDEAMNLFKQDDLSLKETKKLILLLRQLNLTITEDGILKSTDMERKIPYAGASEPNLSLWDRQFLAEEKRVKVIEKYFFAI